jgi:hypothetical protein
MVHVLLIGLTDDQSIGPNASTSLANMQSLLKSFLPPEKLRLQVLSGSDCNAETILQRVRAIGSGPDDSVFCYYFGHGAYDAQIGRGDPSGGHHLQIRPSGDLPRRTLWENLAGRPGRLKILMTDTCNVASRIQLHYEQRTKQMELSGPSNLEQLLLYHGGVLDVSATSPGQYGWSDNEVGGWFTACFCESAQKHGDWRPLLADLAQRTDELFQKRRAAAIAAPTDGLSKERKETLEKLAAQVSMRPAVFRSTVSRIANAEVRPRRTIAVEVTVVVPDGPVSEDPALGAPIPEEGTPPPPR